MAVKGILLDSTDIRMLWYNGSCQDTYTLCYHVNRTLGAASACPGRPAQQAAPGVLSYKGLPTMKTSQEWRSRVYREKEEWRNIPLDIRAEVIKRDKFCRVCEGPGRSIHHIIPRAEGGRNAPDNLILLCVKCHDEVEMAGYRTRAEIEGHLPEWRERKRRRHLKLNNPSSKPDPSNVTDWHLWVYGGYRNPKV